MRRLALALSAAALVAGPFAPSAASSAHASPPPVEEAGSISISAIDLNGDNAIVAPAGSTVTNGQRKVVMRTDLLRYDVALRRTGAVPTLDLTFKVKDVRRGTATKARSVVQSYGAEIVDPRRGGVVVVQSSLVVGDDPVATVYSASKGAPVHCSGLTTKVRPAKETVRLSVPLSCINRAGARTGSVRPHTRTDLRLLHEHITATDSGAGHGRLLLAPLATN